MKPKDKIYYCANESCRAYVGTKFGRGWLEKLLMLPENYVKKFCYRCGRSTEDAKSYECTNFHPMELFEEFCKECGAPKRPLVIPPEE